MTYANLSFGKIWPRLETVCNECVFFDCFGVPLSRIMDFLGFSYASSYSTFLRILFQKSFAILTKQV